VSPRKYSGTSVKTRRNLSMSRTYSTLKSSGTNRLLCGFTTMESASVQPALSDWHSGRMANPAPYAPSMWSHNLNCRQILAISGTGSTLAVEVVPTVAITASGLKPSRTSRAIISLSAFASMQNAASVGTRCTFSSPRPSAIAAFSAELCACSEA
jgi:hypothetical protein